MSPRSFFAPEDGRSADIWPTGPLARFIGVEAPAFVTKTACKAFVVFAHSALRWPIFCDKLVAIATDNFIPILNREISFIAIGWQDEHDSKSKDGRHGCSVLNALIFLFFSFKKWSIFNNIIYIKIVSNFWWHRQTLFMSLIALASVRSWIRCRFRDILKIWPAVCLQSLIVMLNS